MKIIFNRQKILAAVSPLLCAASNKSTLSAIEGILIEAKFPDTCVLTTYDLEKGMSTTVEAKVIEEGSFIINAQKFNQTMRVMDGEEVSLTVDERLSAVMSCGKSTHKTIALRGADFPELPILRNEKGFCVAQKTLKKLFQKTMYAMGINDQRTVLNGCFVRVTDGQLLVVSCDSFRLAKCMMHTNLENINEDGSPLDFHFILPVKTVNELYRLLSDNEEQTLRIHVMRKHIIFHLGDIVFFSRLVDGEYIDFDRIILSNHRIFVTLDKEVLLAALDRAALITEERVAGSVRSHVKLQLEGDSLKILAASTAGSTYDEMEVEHEGDDILIAFNNRFLIDSVRACECDRIKLSLSSPLISVNLQPMEGKDEECEDLFMLLPVRMKE